MQRYYILNGDKTTANGTVIATDHSSTNHGRALAMIGDPVHCPTCKTAGKILPQGPRLRSVFHGREPALDRDLCACKCRPYPLLINSRTDMSERMTTGEIIAQGCGKWIGIKPAPKNSIVLDETKQAAATYSRLIYVSDSSIGKPLINRPFIVDIGGKRQSGSTDGHGYALIQTNGVQEFQLHITFSSPMRELVHDREA